VEILDSDLKIMKVKFKFWTTASPDSIVRENLKTVYESSLMDMLFNGTTNGCKNIYEYFFYTFREVMKLEVYLDGSKIVKYLNPTLEYDTSSVEL